MRALIRDTKTLLVIGIGLVLFGLTYAINGLTQGMVRVPVRFDEGAHVDGLIDGLYTYDALIEIWDLTFADSLAHRNVSTGLLAIILGAALIVRSRELTRNRLSGWNGSAVLLIVAGIVPTSYAVNMYNNVLFAHNYDLTPTSGPIEPAWIYLVIGIVLWLRRNEYVRTQTPASQMYSQPSQAAADR